MNTIAKMALIAVIVLFTVLLLWGLRRRLGHSAGLSNSHDPPQLAGLVVRGLPRAGQQLMVIGIRATPQDELRLIGGLVINGIEARHRDDDVAILNYDNEAL
jgi:hypothetical protein